MLKEIDGLLDFVTVSGSEPITDSRRVAKHFVKQHRNVLRDVRALLANTGDWGLLNFEQCFEINGLANGKPEPFYRMTKDGFMLLVMGFTGKKALVIKLAFIRAFNAMTDLLRSGLWQRRLDAEAAFLDGKEQATVNGKGLRRWRDEKPERLRIIAALDAQMQIPLQFS